ncbi:hypothetical protein CAPTEDRAFT_196581 [Capitella teleta]|uniref:Uncharacterized protein n=1 Tax=Capitella teleta TaxID=283909 RepID=R7U8K6_CAPTE|nr:hypothetical protein CAPTEDRAFT_196581 [Capitella teleta]|eukprot:ELU02710.1 hypothetical protein CAPTEDRAFT_196581 [Capitella teleta]
MTPVARSGLEPGTSISTVVWDCTFVETTIAQTTEGPTTILPTAEGPTTIVPTTEGPTTIVPTTEGPTTIVPTTEGPTTIVPTTEGPTTIVPTTEGPTTIVPTTEGPTTIVPTTEGPTTIVPTTIGPTTVVPRTEAGLTTIVLIAEGPTTNAPTTEGPTTTLLSPGVSTTTQGTATVTTSEHKTTIVQTVELTSKEFAYEDEATTEDTASQHIPSGSTISPLTELTSLPPLTRTFSKFSFKSTYNSPVLTITPTLPRNSNHYSLHLEKTEQKYFILEPTEAFMAQAIGFSFLVFLIAELCLIITMDISNYRKGFAYGRKSLRMCRRRSCRKRKTRRVSDFEENESDGTPRIETSEL